MRIRPSLTALLLLLSTMVHGQKTVFSDGDFDFTVIEHDPTSVRLKALGGTLKGDVVIPESATYQGNTYVVSEIEDLGNNPDVKSLRIPKTVHSIMNDFYELRGLQNIYVDKDNPSYLSIDGVLINSYNMSLIEYPQGRTGEYQVPEGIKRIQSAFHSEVPKLIISSTVEYVEPYTGSYINEYEVAEGNATYKSINGALCSKDGKTLIAYPTTNVSTISIPESIDSIGVYAIRQEKNIILKSGTPPSIGHNSWYDYNTSISGIYVKSEYLSNYRTNAKTSRYNIIGYDYIADSLIYTKTNNGEVELAGSYRRSVSIEIPQTVKDESNNSYTVTSIGRRVFYQNYNLKEIKLPETLESIGDSAFYNTDIYEITLPASLTTIGKNAFYYCWNLQYVYAECAPIDISNGCFYNYRTLYVPSEYEEQYKSAYGWSYFSPIIAKDLIFGDFVLKKLSAETVSIMKYTGKQTDITIPDEVTIDGKDYKVTAIGNNAFESKGLTSVELPRWLEAIGENAFSYNYRLKAIDFPNTLKTIGNYAFGDCNLYSLRLPSSVETIEDYAFSSNYNLNTIICEGKTPCTLGYYPFYTNSYLKILVMPSSSVGIYKSTNSWQRYNDYIFGADAIVDEIAYQKLDNQTVALTCCLKNYNSENYNRLSIPEKVNIDNIDYRVAVIGEGAFISSSYLKELTLPESIDSIGSKAFNYNINLRMESQTPPKTNNNTFYNYPQKVIVPLVALDSYKTAEYWQNLSDRIIAYDILIDGVAYLKIDNTHAAVCGVLSMPENGLLDIPETVKIDGNDYTVSVIGSQAFSNNNGKLLTLPQTIDSIAANAYYGNFRLVYLKSTTPPRLGSYNYNNVYVPSSVLNTYQNNAQWVSSSYYKKYIHGTDGIICNDSIIYNINERYSTAELCSWMKKSTDIIEVPKAVTLEGSVYSITSLREYAFSDYYYVKTFRIPESVSVIGNYTLPTSSDLTVSVEAIVPPTIGNQSNVQSQTLYVKSAAYDNYTTAETWRDFGNIVAIDEGDNQFYYAKAGNGKAIVTGVKTTTNTEVEIPETVVIDGEILKVVQLGSKLFMNNYYIQKVKLPNTIEEIGDMAFYGTSLQQITIPASVKNIGERAFAINVDYNTYNYLSKIQVRAGNENYMDRNENLLLSKDGKTLLQTAQRGGEISTWWGYDENDIYGEHESNPLDGVETIAAGALDGCQIYRIKLPSSLKNADASMLMYMSYLEEINVDENHQNLCSVDGVLFSKDTTTIVYFPYNKSYNYDYRDYELPTEVQRIGKFAFYNSRFENLTLSDSLKTIADSAFYSRNYNYTNSLTLLNEEIAVASGTAFTDNMYQNTVLYVPMGTQNDYLNTNPWRNFRTINSAKLSDEDFQLLKAFYEEMGNGEGWYHQWALGETAEETRLTRGIRMIDEHVYSIDLSNNGLKGGLSDKLFKLPYLEKLNLSDNQLACPIDSVLNDENIDNYVLEELDISNNQFTGNIGSVANTLKNLTTLNASYNKLTQVSPMLPSSLYDLNLIGQEMGTISYKDIYTADAEMVETNQPNLLYYNHPAQNYTSYHTFNLRNTDGDTWQMTLDSNGGDKNLYVPSENYWLYKRPNGDLFYLTSYSDNHSAIVKMQFDPGDVNFDTEVNVSDLQLTVDYAVEQMPQQMFNFTTADIQADDWVNVQDVVCIVNLLLDQDVETNLVRRAGTRAMVATEEDAEATLFWRGNLLILKSERDVAALDIAISNAKDVKWMLNDVDYDFSVSKKNDYIRIVHYSMAGKRIKAGETVIAEIVGNAANVLKAELVDKNSKPIKTFSSGTATAIQEIASSSDMIVNADVAGVNIHTNKPVSDLQWTVYSIGGQMLGRGVTNLSSGSNSLTCNLAGETQVIVRLMSEHVNIIKKVSITK